MTAQCAQCRVEPNYELGKNFSFLLNHWSKLTLFLSQPGSPLDNNIVERSLKKAILNRRNALFYKTLNGSAVGDLFMSLTRQSRNQTGKGYDAEMAIELLTERHGGQISGVLGC